MRCLVEGTVPCKSINELGRCSDTKSITVTFLDNDVHVDADPGNGALDHAMASHGQRMDGTEHRLQTVREFLGIEEDDREWHDSWNSAELDRFEISVLEYARHVSEDIIRVSRTTRASSSSTFSRRSSSGPEPQKLHGKRDEHEREGEKQGKEQDRERTQQRDWSGVSSYMEEFPRLGSSVGMTRRDKERTSILESRIVSPAGGLGGKDGYVTRTHSSSKGSTRRIVPTAVDSVHVDETFMAPSSMEEPSLMFAPAAASAAPSRDKDGSKMMSYHHGNGICRRVDERGSREVPLHHEACPRLTDDQDSNHVLCTPDQDGTGKSLSRVDIEDDFPRNFGSLRFDPFESLADVDPDGIKRPGSKDGDADDIDLKETSLNDAISRLALLHGKILESSPRIFLMSEISLLFDLFGIDPGITIDGEVDGEGRVGLRSGIDAVNYAATVILSSGNLLQGLGRDILEDVLSYLKTISHIKSNVLRTLRRVVSDAILSQEPTSLLHSPSFGRVHNSGRFVGLTGLNVFLNDSSGFISRSSDDQKKVSNRETFRDTWFKLMRDAVNRSTSLDALQHRAGPKVVSQTVSEERHGDLVVLKIIQEGSGQLLRGLRIDNYEAFAELFTAAVLQAAITGETLMDEELTGIAKQNLSRFESLSKRFVQTTNTTKNTAQTQRSHQKNSMLSRKGQVDHSAEHALRVSGEFPKPLRPFVLFLEATDSHRLNSILARTMKTKLYSVLKSLTDSTSLNDGSMLSLEEMCISTTSLAGFLGYFSFTKGQTGWQDFSPSLQRLQDQGEFDGSHSIDALNALQQCIPASRGLTSFPGNLYRYIPWICRYLKFLTWNRELCRTNYFKRLFGILQNIRQHPYLQPSSHCFRGIAPLCLRGMLDNFSWDFEDEMLNSKHDEIHVDTLDFALEDDIRWANTIIGRRYLEMTCPEVSYLRTIISSKVSPSVSSGQETKTRKKIRPTIPVQKEFNVSSLPRIQIGQDTSNAPSSQFIKEKVREKLERVFLDQYSNPALVTDVKLRDFVAWCSDAIARQGVSAGLEQASRLHIEEISKDMEDIVSQYKQEGQVSNQNIDKQKLRLLARGMEDHFAARYCRALQAASTAALQARITKDSKQSAEILLPDSWGTQVKMTAAAIIARRAESAGMRQLLSELKKVGLSRTKKDLEFILNRL